MLHVHKKYKVEPCSQRLVLGAADVAGARAERAVCLLGSLAVVAAGSGNKKWPRMRRRVKKELRQLNESLSGACQNGGQQSRSARGAHGSIGNLS